MKQIICRAFCSILLTASAISYSWADETPIEPEPTPTPYKCGETSYATIEDAFRQSGTVTITENVSVENITITNGEILEIGNGVTVTGNITIANGGTLNIVAGNTVNGNVTNNGTLVMSSGKITGTLTNNTTATLSLTGGSVGEIVNNSTLTLSTGTINAAITNKGTLTISGATVGGNITNNASRELTISSGTINGTISNSGSLTINGGAVNNTVTNHGTFTMTDGSITASGTALNIVSGATTSISGGTITATGSEAKAINFGEAASITGGTFIAHGHANATDDAFNGWNDDYNKTTNNSAMTSSASAASPYTITSSLSTAKVVATANNRGYHSVAKAFVLSDDVTLTKNTTEDITIASGKNLAITSNVTITGNVTNNGTLVMSNGTITGTLTNNTANLTLTGGTVNGGITNTSSLTLASGTINAAITNNGTLTVSGAIVSGNITNVASKELTISAGTVNGTISNSGSLTINGGAVNNTVTNNGTFTMTDGSITAATGNALTTTASSTTKISGGTITTNEGGYAIAFGEAAEVSGGTFVVNGRNTGIAVNGWVETYNTKKTGTTLTTSIVGSTITSKISNEGVVAVGSNDLGYLSVNDALAHDANVKLTASTSENVVIPADKKLTISSAVTLTGTIENNGTLAMTAGTVSSNITNNGTMTFENASIGGNLTNGGTLTMSSGTITGSLTNNTANLTLTGGTVTGSITNTSSLTLASGTINAAISNNGTLTISGATIDGAVTNNGTFKMTQGSITATGTALTIASTSTSTTISGGTITGNGADGYAIKFGKEASITGGTFVAAGHATNTGDSFINWNDDYNKKTDGTAMTPVVTGDASSYTITSTLSDVNVVATGADGRGYLSVAKAFALSDKVTMKKSTSEAITISAEKTLNLSSEGIELSGAITNAGTFNVSNGTVSGTVENTNKLKVSNGTVSGTITNSSELTVSGGTISGATTNTGTMEVSAGSITNNITDNGTLTMTGGSITGNVSGTGAVTMSAGTITGDITVDGALTISETGAVSGAITANGAFTMLAGSISNTNSTALTANGTVSISGGTITSTNSAYAVVLGATSTGTISETTITAKGTSCKAVNYIEGSAVAITGGKYIVDGVAVTNAFDGFGSVPTLGTPDPVYYPITNTVNTTSTTTVKQVYAADHGLQYDDTKKSLTFGTDALIEGTVQFTEILNNATGNICSIIVTEAQTSNVSAETLLNTAKGCDKVSLNTIIYVKGATTPKKVMGKTIRKVEGETPQNIVVEADGQYTCENFVLADQSKGDDNGRANQPLSIPISFKAANAKYTRTVSSTWGTVLLPFALKSNETEARYYHLNWGDIMGDGVGDEYGYGYIRIYAVDDVAANQPTIFMKKGDNEVIFSNTNVDVVATPASIAPSSSYCFYLRGVYDKTIYFKQDISDAEKAEIKTDYSVVRNDIDIKNIYYFSGDMFWQAELSVTIRPFRAFVEYNVSSASEARRRVAYNLLESEADIETSINIAELDKEEEPVEYYNINGVKTSIPTRGVNIVKMSDGSIKKIIKK